MWNLIEPKTRTPINHILIQCILKNDNSIIKNDNETG